MVQHADIPPPQSATRCLHPVARKLLLISRPTKGRRLSWPAHTIGITQETAWHHILTHQPEASRQGLVAILNNPKHCSTSWQIERTIAKCRSVRRTVWMQKCSTMACFKCEIATSTLLLTRYRNAMTACSESTGLGNSPRSEMPSRHQYLLSNYNSMGDINSM